VFPVVTLFVTSAQAAADPTDARADNDKLFALLSGGYTAADCQAGKQYPEILSSHGWAAAATVSPAALMVPSIPFTEMSPT
jgi:hypothetical protein